MPGPAATAAERAPRRARYLIPQDTHRRGEIVAAIIGAVLLVHLVFAQLTLVLAVALGALGRATRWRALWLAAPAAAGGIWALATGPAASVTGLIAGPRQVAGYLGGIAGHPGRLVHLGSAFNGIGHWLPRQLPLALVLAAAEAAVWAWLSWLHTDELALAPARPGLIVAVRRRYTRRAVRAGGVISRDGGRLGIDEDGRGAGISWREAEGGVLAAGRESATPASPAAPGWAAGGPSPAAGHRAPSAARPVLPGSGPASSGSGPAMARRLAGRLAPPGQLASLADRLASVPGWRAPRAGQQAPPRPGLAPCGPGPAGTGFQLAYAAIRRRKPVIIVDLTAHDWLPGSLAAVCQAAGAPLYQFGQAGQGFYDPLRGSAPTRAASLVMGTIDWAGLTAARHRACAAYLGALFAVRGAAPIDPRQPVLQDVLRLLDPAALRERLSLVPAHHPRRGALAGLVASSTAQTEADPAGLPDIAGQLSRLQISPAGRWLGQRTQQAGSQQLSLGRVLRQRGVCLFALDPAQDGPFAAMIARLVAFDAMALFADLQAIPVSGDGLAWFSGCELLDRTTLAELVARGGRAGTTVVLSTTSERAAASLAADVNVLALHQLADPAAARRLAELASTRSPGSGYPESSYPDGGYPDPGPAGTRPPGPGQAGPGTPGAVLPGLRQAGSGQAGSGQDLAPPGSAPPGYGQLGSGQHSAGLPPAAQPVPAWALRVPVLSDPSVPPGSAVPPASPVLPLPSTPLDPAAPPIPGAERGLAATSASTGPRRAPHHPFRKNERPAVTQETLLSLRGDAFALIVKGPEPRIRSRCRAVPAGLPTEEA
ncbi:MAG: hypothetical protein ABJB47_12320 [Actinomycetota bacterium]